MERTTKQIIAVIAGLIILFVAIYGSYLPMRKAQIFIATLQDIQTNPVSSINDLETRLSNSLDYPSPIGQEELVRNLANSVLSFVQNNTEASSTDAIMSFLDSYYNPILSQGKGMSFGQDLYLSGAINEVAFVKTGEPMYLEAAKQWYLEGEQLGPERPQPLYGLFDVYRFEGDATDSIAIGQKILSLWPTDSNVQTALMQLEASTSTETSK